MNRIFHAAGIAVAAIALVATASLAASEGSNDQALKSSSYGDHGAALIQESDLALNDAPAVNSAASPTEGGAAPFIQHVVAFVSGGDEAPRPLSLNELVQAYESDEIVDAEQECLAGAVYFESRSEPIEGQLAVAEVVLNRAASGLYPTSICGVVTQPSQFSFISRGRFPRADKSSEAWRTAVAVSRIAKDDLARQVSRDVLWYHAAYVSPSWGRRLNRQTRIGLHIFYS